MRFPLTVSASRPVSAGTATLSGGDSSQTNRPVTWWWPGANSSAGSSSLDTTAAGLPSTRTSRGQCSSLPGSLASPA